MSRLLKPVSIDDPRELLELVSGAIGEIVYGGVLIESALGNEEYGYFDLLAVNGDGEGVIFFINFSGCETEYLRLLKCLRWFQDNRHVLQKVYAGRVALGRIPQVFVVSPRYSAGMQKVLFTIGEAREYLVTAPQVSQAQ